MAKQVLAKENIKLNVSLNNQEEAIRYAGQILVDNGYVEPSYIDKMFEREELTSTYMGNFVAIPHGTEDAKSEVNESGLSIVTIPEGVEYGEGNTVKILMGIAGKGDEHLDILSNIAIVLSDEDNIQLILDAESEAEIIRIFDEVN